MYAELDVKYMEESGNEFSDVLKTMKLYEEEIDSVNRTLAALPDFAGCAARLRDINVNMSDTRCKLSGLAQILRNISGIYRRAEISAGEGFEGTKPSYSDAKVVKNDLTAAGIKTERVLYGGDR